jgi:hypothetical protein
MIRSHVFSYMAQLIAQIPLDVGYVFLCLEKPSRGLGGRASCGDGVIV